eukprot:m.144435 g.144435  ORF g.144435 m.144435 type:complete len:763 (+) comp10061_c0_seq9:226-2514(+)
MIRRAKLGLAPPQRTQTAAGGASSPKTTTAALMRVPSAQAAPAAPGAAHKTTGHSPRRGAGGLRRGVGILRMEQSAHSGAAGLFPLPQQQQQAQAQALMQQMQFQAQVQQNAQAQMQALQNVQAQLAQKRQQYAAAIQQAVDQIQEATQAQDQQLQDSSNQFMQLLAEHLEVQRQYAECYQIVQQLNFEYHRVREMSNRLEAALGQAIGHVPDEKTASALQQMANEARNISAQDVFVSAQHQQMQHMQLQQQQVQHAAMQQLVSQASAASTSMAASVAASAALAQARRTPKRSADGMPAAAPAAAAAAAVAAAISASSSSAADASASKRPRLDTVPTPKAKQEPVDDDMGEEDEDESVVEEDEDEDEDETERELTIDSPSVKTGTAPATNGVSAAPSAFATAAATSTNPVAAPTASATAPTSSTKAAASATATEVTKSATIHVLKGPSDAPCVCQPDAPSVRRKFVLSSTLQGAITNHAVTWLRNDLLIAGQKGSFGFWSVGTAAPIAEIALGTSDDVVECKTLGSDRKSLAVAPASGPVRIFDIQASGHARQSAVLTDAVGIVYIVPSTATENLFYSSDRQGMIAQWDIRQRKAAHKFSGKADGATCIGLYEGERTLVSGGRHGIVRLWDVRQDFAAGPSRFSVDSAITCIATSPRSPWIVCGLKKNNIIAVNSKKQDRYSLRFHDAPITSATFARSSNFLLTASEDGVVACWDSYRGGLSTSFKTSDSSRLTLSSLSPDDCHIVVRHDSGAAQFVRLETV